MSSPTGRETLTNDFFVNLLDMNTEWKPSSKMRSLFEGRMIARRRSQVDRYAASTSCLARTRSSERSRKPTRVTTRNEAFVRDFVSLHGIR